MLCIRSEHLWNWIYLEIRFIRKFNVSPMKYSFICLVSAEAEAPETLGLYLA